MPWNCLCSSKEKRKLEISAPIINIEDSCNQQLVSSLKPRPFLLPATGTKTTKYLSNCNNQKISDKSIIKNDQQKNIKKSKKSKNNNCNNISSSNSIVTETPASTDNLLVSGKKLKKQKNLKHDEKKLLKQQQKQQQKLIIKTNNNGIGNGCSSGASNDKITKQLANVKFSFDKSTASITDDTTESCENKPKVCINAPSCYENINDEKTRSNLSVFLLCDGINNAATTTAAVDSVDNNKINENVTNVDRIQETQNVQQQQEKELFEQQKQKERLQEMINENAGNYDEIPFVQNENFIAESYAGKNSSVHELHQQNNNNRVKNQDTTNTVSKIPFIDDELHLLIQKNTTENLSTSQTHNKNILVDDHNARFITIHPQNIGSFQTITNAIIPTATTTSSEPNHPNGMSLTVLRDEQTENYYFEEDQIINFELNNNTVKRGGKMITTTINNDEMNPTNPNNIKEEILPPTLIQQQRIPVEHDFQSWKIIKGKLCQLCHESLLKKPSCILKCRSCDLICHNWCATAMPSIRYHDTSYIINRKWLKGGDELTFPIVHHFVNSDAKIRSESNNNEKFFHYATDNENDKSIQQQRRRNNYKDKPRRRTRSLEKRKRPLSAVHQDLETSDDDELIQMKINENLNNESQLIKKNSDEIVSSCNEAENDTNTTNSKHINSKDDENNNNKNNVFHLCHERVIRLEIIEKPNNNKNLDSITNNEESQQNNNVTSDCNNLVVSKEFQIPQIIETNPNYEQTKLDTISSTSTILTNRNFNQNVIVDVHRRPDSVASSNLSSEILMINENSSDDEIDNIVTKDINDVPEYNQQRTKKNISNGVGDNDKNKRNSRSSDSSDKTITQENQIINNNNNINNLKISTISTNNNNENSKNNDKPIILSGKRFFYIQGTSNSSSGMSASSSSTINDIDEDSSMDDYEQVDLRRSATSQSLPVQNSHQSLSKNLNDNDIRIDHNNISKSQSFPVQNKHQNHQDHRSNLQISNNLHLHYVTQRILASILPRREPAAINDIQSIGPHNENQQQDKYEKEVLSMLEQKHGKNYRVFDLESCISVITLERICELCKYIDKWLGSGQEKVVVLQDREDRQRLGAAIAAYLEYLDICATNFATTSRNKNQRHSSSTTGIGSCSQDDLRAQNAITKNWLDLDIFSMKKFLEDFIGPLRIPSHKRYINYFSGLLSGKIKLNASPLILKYIAIESPPSWLQYNRMSSDTEWNSFIKIYEGLRCVYTSDIHIIPITTRQFLYQIGNLQLRGDILIRCYQIVSSTTTNSTLHNNNNNNYYTNGDGNIHDKRELLFSLQFHTCAMFATEVTFKKDDLDYAWCDNRFPNDCRVTCHFNKASGTKNITNDNGYVFQSPLIRTEPPNALAKSNSIENFDLSTKYQGPLDGSLYATILKSPKSSQYPPITSPAQQHQQNRASSVSLLTNLISPPPQFSNNNNIQQQFDTSTPIRQTARHSIEPNRLSSTSTTTITSTSSSTNQQQQQQQQNSSRPGTLNRSSQSQPRTDYFYVENRPSETLQQSNYRNSVNKYSPSTSGGQQQPQQHNTAVVETYQRTQQNRTSGGQQNYHQSHNQQSSQQNGTGRDSVRSPLTLSMDSGISSSGVLRAQQGSSVSPSSFPSQASPQEDRHRELDDILSDMLMTVQDIPDFNNKVQRNNKTNTINSKHSTIYRQQQQQQHNTIRSQSVIPTLPQKTIQIQPATSLYVLPVVQPNYNTTNNRELKRSVSYAAYENSQPQQTIIINPYLSVKDLYDTASTTTTLTPPPSESGRDTPTQHNSQRCLHHQQQYEQRQKQNRFDTLSSMASSTNTLTSQATTTTTRSCTNRTGGGNNNLQQNISPQLTKNHHQVRTTTKQISVSEDDDNIPYHAREHSKPFTYGNVPNGHQLSETPIQIGDDELDTSVEIFDPKMIKAQSGLSSPSLVRKFGGGGNNNVTITNQSSTQSTLRKTPARNDFEDMLRERREKVMSEKYLISDKPTSVDQNQKWINTTVNQTNGYHYYNEPLKRSNTLDGFQRSNSTDGLSGQTWLQLQQQKLRAKKGQQLRDERKYFEEIHTEIRNRPQRSLANGRRYDGYASDTAAFGDEVDYRRPLHVQMPYNTSRSPERKYNTITTTTTTTTSNKERPFVAIKRAHEQAKRENVGSPPLSPLSLLNASPTGHIINQNGLLSMAESTRNGQNRLESDINEANDINNKIACKNVYSSTSYNNSNSHNKTSINNHNCNNNNNNSNNINNNQNIINHNAINNNGTITTTNIITTTASTNNNYHASINNENIQNGINNSSPENSELDSLSSDSLNNIALNGQLALDRLLASLAIEAELMSKQLATTNNNCITNSAKSSQEHQSVINCNNNNNIELRINGDDAPVINNNYHRHTATTVSVKDNQDLNDVLADLNEFTRFEAFRQQMHTNHNNNNNGGCYSDSIISSNNSNSNSSNSPINGGIPRRLLVAAASESENSSSVSPSLSERSNHALWNDQMREESFSSYRSETDHELSSTGSPRPETPAFPVTPRTPYGLSNGSVSPALPPKSPTSLRRFNNSSWSLRSQKSAASNLDVSKDLYSGTQKGHVEFANQNDQIHYTTRRNSNTSTTTSEPQEVAPHHVKFVRDSSKYWYKPTISREEAIALLRHAQPGTFLVRDSTTFKNAFGLVVRVAQLPPGVTAKQGGDEFVRHFLVEPTSRGVRLKGCANEPVFTSLSALVYQHSIMPLALPCRLLIPDRDIQSVEIHTPAQKQLLSQGAACNVLYLYACDTESLTGEEAVRRAVSQLYSRKPIPIPTEVHFKVAQQGITLTDNTRQKFFRKHYSNNIVSFCGFDPDRRTWSIKTEGDFPVQNKTIFAFVARRSASSHDNQCHVFCDLAPNQPATAIVSFVNKVLPTEKSVNENI